MHLQPRRPVENYQPPAPPPPPPGKPHLIGMGQGPTDPSVIEDRRRHVAAMALRGLGLREIGKALAGPEINSRNPRSGEPWSRATIENDLAFLRVQWREQAAADIADHQSRLLAELREIRRAAWTKGALTLAMQTVAEECRILGAYAPIRIGPAGVAPDDPFARFDLRDMPLDQLRLLQTMNVIPTTATAVDVTPE